MYHGEIGKNDANYNHEYHTSDDSLGLAPEDGLKHSIIAHCLSTIRNCDKIYEIVDGKANLKNKVEVYDK